MRKKYLVILLLCCASTMLAQTVENKKSPVYQGFSGGMLLHTGYLFGTSDAPQHNRWSGATFGIGGSLRVNLWKHLRVGGEGFVSTMPSATSNLAHHLKDGSYVRSGWGGVLMDACWRTEKVWPYVGASVGGGSCKSLYIYDGNQTDWVAESDAFFNKQTFCYVCPYVGMDYCMTSKVHLSFRIDWLLAIRHAQLIEPTGPRIYLGFMFCH